MLRPFLSLCAVFAFASVGVCQGRPSSGDMNGDGRLNVGDPLHLLTHLFLKGPKPVPCDECPYGELKRGDVNHDSRMNAADAVFLLMFLFLQGERPSDCLSCYPCEPSRLPATGSDKCWDADARVEIPCDNEEWPGQDGFYRAGCPPEHRFLDNGDGTVSDTCTGLMWQRDTPMPPPEYDPDEYGRLSWQMALRFCEDLELAGYDDWRLPNGLELSTLGEGWSRVPTELALNELFWDRSIPDEADNMPGGWWYWSSSYYACRRVCSCVTFRRLTDFGCSPDWEREFTRAVRGGLDGACASSIPATGINTCYHGIDEVPIPCDTAGFPGQDAFYKAGRPIEGRFYDNGDGTVTDLATGLMWVRETPDLGPEYNPDEKGKVYWQQALQFCHNLEFAGYDDWRLPNVAEMLSIAQPWPWPEAPAELVPFVLKSSTYWSSTYAPNGASFWVSRCFDFSTFGSAQGAMTGHVHPVRGGL